MQAAINCESKYALRSKRHSDSRSSDWLVVRFEADTDYGRGFIADHGQPRGVVVGPLCALMLIKLIEWIPRLIWTSATLKTSRPIWPNSTRKNPSRAAETALSRWSRTSTKTYRTSNLPGSFWSRSHRLLNKRRLSRSHHSLHTKLRKLLCRHRNATSSQAECTSSWGTVELVTTSKH